MKIAAYILFALQALSIFGNIMSGSFGQMMGNMLFGGVMGISSALGFFLPTIIGIILLRKHNKKHNSWTCESCGTRNPNSIQACKKCGSHK